MTPNMRHTLAIALLVTLSACTSDNIRWSQKGVASSAKGPVIRINFGRLEPYKDSAGNTWLGDTGMETGDIVDRGAAMAIKNTKDPDLYRTEHWGMDGLSYAVPNGRYLVKLHFAETSENVSGPGGRVFTMTVEGKEFKDFDVWARAGGFATPYVETLPVTIADGKLDITFVVSAEQNEINAIEVIPE